VLLRIASFAHPRARRRPFVPGIKRATALVAIFNPGGNQSMKKLLFVLFLSYATAASAESACDKPRDDFDGIYCLNKIYLEADKELN
jgi:hypothetical protein